MREVVEDGRALAAGTELAAEIAAQPLPALLEVKRRALLAAEHARGALFADEERVFHDALLSG